MAARCHDCFAAFTALRAAAYKFQKTSPSFGRGKTGRIARRRSSQPIRHPCIPFLSPDWNFARPSFRYGLLRDALRQRGHLRGQAAAAIIWSPAVPHLAHLEQWVSSHPTHLAIYDRFMAMVQEHNFQLNIKLWHEVAVLPGNGQQFEYINCHPETGLLPDFDWPLSRTLIASRRPGGRDSIAKFQRIRSTHCAREGPGAKASPKYWVSRATLPSRNSMMLTV